MTEFRRSWTVAMLLTLVRMAVGWHLLYEGLVKFIDRQWTAAGYLQDSTWLLRPYFLRLTEHPQLMWIVDMLNVWGLMLIGLALVLGVCTRLSAVLGALLIFLYYLANPPLVGLRTFGEGNYLVVNKNLIETLVLLSLAAIPRGWMFGIDHLMASLRDRRRFFEEKAPAESLSPAEAKLELAAAPRRQVLKNLIGVPVLGALGFSVHRKQEWKSLEEKYLHEAGADATSGATLKHLNYGKLADLKGTMTYGQIGKLKISRMILGGNLIGGWAHSRDLMYVSDLVLAYHDDNRIINTLRLAEKCGVNTLLTHPKLLRIIRKYWHECDGTIQYISDCGGGDLLGMTKLAIDGGAHACYVQGATADQLVESGKIDVIQQALDLTRANGLPAGIGAHLIKTVKACKAAGIRPDFWMKTFHHHNYWSAKQTDGSDNTLYSVFCPDPQETVEVMRDCSEPWIAFKTLAAGAIPPQEGFSYAFANGADFICVGMYDFQLVQDVNLATQALAAVTTRERAWCA